MTPDEEAKAKYYEYVPDNSEWWIKEAPAREPWFEARLAEIGGRHANGKPNLIVVWGGTHMHDYTERPQLKYQAVRRIIKGYSYEKLDGSQGYVRKGHRLSDEEISQIKDKLAMVPVKEDHAFGRLRWIVERYCPPEKLRKLGRFTNLYAPDGEKILRDFPNEGVYDCFFVIQRKNNTYRDLDGQVLAAIEAMWHYNLSIEEAQAGLDAIDEQNERTIIAAQEARSVFVH